ncbi:MAG: hypothetical protein II062_03070 [Oscillospiraceae bacterium]|nr:hypothetical protein [Oscillospiraceae bacterium]
MNRTKKLTFSALIAAICTLVLAGSALLPKVTLSLAAFAGLFPAVVVIVCGYGWAIGASAVAGALALLLLPEKTAGVWFLFFFGHYPIWKQLIESWQAKEEMPLWGWILKVLGFSACMALLYWLFGSLFAAAIPFAFAEYTFGPYILLIALAICFVMYDMAFSILIGWFRVKVLPKLK